MTCAAPSTTEAGVTATLSGSTTAGPSVETDCAPVVTVTDWAPALAVASAITVASTVVGDNTRSPLTVMPAANRTVVTPSTKLVAVPENVTVAG